MPNFSKKKPSYDICPKEPVNAVPDDEVFSTDIVKVSDNDDLDPSFVWNNIKWRGIDCDPNPLWTPCGCKTCTIYGSDITECYDLS